MKLNFKLRISFFLISFIPVVASCAIILLMSLGSTRKEKSQYYDTFCINAAQNVSTFFGEKLAIVRSLSEFTEVGEHDWSVAKKPCTSIVGDGFFEKIILAKKDGTYHNTGSGNPYFDDMATSDNKSPNATLSSIAARDYFKEIVTNNTRQAKMGKVSEPVVSLSNGVRQIMVCHSIFDSENQLSGMVAGAVSWDLFTKELDNLQAMARQTFGVPIKMVIVNAKGTVVYHWNEDLVIHVEETGGSKKTVTKTVADLPDNFRNYAEQMAAGKNDFHTVEYSLDGEKCLFGFAPIGGTDMTLGIFIERSFLFKAIADQFKASILWFIFVMTAVTIFSFVFAKRLVVPMQVIANGLGGLATGGGDLTLKLPQRGNDVISRISGNFNKFVDVLRDIIFSIIKNAEQLGGVSENLNSTVADTKTAISEITDQTGNLSQNAVNLSASIEETTSTVHEIAKTIESLNGQISVQSENVNNSSAAIEEMVANIQSVSTNLGRANHTFNELKGASENGRSTMDGVIESIKETAQHSEQLLEANDMIEAIASQTNLLAMNAAIEAAHAGDAGRGFSVVADEIRKLAEEAGEQSNRIAEMLRIVVDNIESVVGQSNAAGEAFENISVQIGDVNDLMSEVSFSMSEQSAGSQQVLESLKVMQDISNQILGGSAEMTSGAAMVQKEMVNLQNFAYQVKDVTQNVNSKMGVISKSVESVSSLADKNSMLSTTLLEQTKGFKL